MRVVELHPIRAVLAAAGYLSVAGVAAALVSLPLSFGCASAALPKNEMSTTRQSIQAARAIGASAHPDASLYLRMADLGFETAERLIEEGEYERASLLLRQADADARLAEELQRESMAKQDAESALLRMREVSSR
jgi:hypothetical protein